MRKIQRGTGEHYIETQVENKVGEGGRGGREHPPPTPYHIPPNPSLPGKKLSLWETGQVRMSGMSVKSKCGTTQGHHTYSDERWATPHWWRWEEDLVLMVCDSQMDQMCVAVEKLQPTHRSESGLRLRHACASGIWTENVVYLPRIHTQKCATTYVQYKTQPQTIYLTQYHRENKHSQ